MEALAWNTTEIRLLGEKESEVLLRSLLLTWSWRSADGPAGSTTVVAPVRLSLNAGSRVRTSFYVEPWMRIDTLVRIMKRVSLDFLVWSAVAGINAYAGWIGVVRAISALL
jgi:hypothetical protein